MKMKANIAENRNDRLKGIIAALLLLLLLFMLSLFMGFYYPEPPIPDEGVEIDMGGGGSSGGMEGTQSIPEPQSASKPLPSSSSSTYVTDDRDDNPYSPVATPSTKPTEATRVIQPEPPKKQVNPNAMFTKKGSSNAPGNGSSSGPGQGGGKGDKPGDGTGPGIGTDIGPSFSIVGRTAKALPKPSYDSNSQGKIVIDVKVDQSGNVTGAQYNSRLSNISDLKLIAAAIDAAKKSKFSVKLDAAVEQVGTITYTFIKLN